MLKSYYVAEAFTGWFAGHLLVLLPEFILKRSAKLNQFH
jgi:hypothetical protein